MSHFLDLCLFLTMVEWYLYNSNHNTGYQLKFSYWCVSVYSYICLTLRRPCHTRQLLSTHVNFKDIYNEDRIEKINRKLISVLYTYCNSNKRIKYISFIIKLDIKFISLHTLSSVTGPLN